MQLTREQHIEGYENQLRGLKKQQREHSDLKKLVESPLFRKVILQNFCTDECARYVRMSVDMALTPEARADALAKAQAGAHLLHWIAVEDRMGSDSVNKISTLEANLEVLRSASDDDIDGLDLQ
ncbi:hypothetical protein JJJA_0073 [Achromobacter phage JWDelta]|uniref:Uncharacterized protein n=2 Tax=Jwalphavirus jwalpha TaxID=2169963 RepID=V9VEK9_9CAUD|nr:hypothetical protein CH29_gp76 [Achromobacter phage JWAlpha]AHC56589.1 hypothetical protein JJJA_0073 [Achromobacter phage JWDelta]AHC94029.1 hypothetical protein JJJB_0076 [Achromobacter phage JWAlpha]